MINFKCEENGSLTVSISEEIRSILNENDFPLVLNVYDISNRIHHFDNNLYVNCYSVCLDSSYKTAKIFTSKGRLIFEWSWDSKVNGDLSHQLFELWSELNLGAPGIVIGAHNGTSGEWVGPVISGKLKAILIEPSDSAMIDLSRLYKNRNLVSLEKTAITSNGGDVDFYEFDEFQKGQLNSIHIENLLNIAPIESIKKTRIESKKISDILDKYKIGNEKWWLHVDAEGEDSAIIKSLNLKNYILPACLIYEESSGSEDMENWLDENNYISYRSKNNRICFLNL